MRKTKPKDRKPQQQPRGDLQMVIESLYLLFVSMVSIEY